MSHSKPTLVIIAGPTAVGKTSLSIAIAQYYNTAVLSVDSRQCYKEIPIGTAAPSMVEQDGVPHYFIGSHSIFDEMNAGQYEHYALDILNTLFAQHQIVVACGGTGLYIDAVCNGIDPMPSTDKTIEQALQEDFQTNGLAWLQATCEKEDPVFWAVAEQQNPVRLIRALAFLRTNNESITKYRTKKIKERPFNIVKIALDLPRNELYERINQRVYQMIDNGLLHEVEQLFEHRKCKNLATVGYSEFYEYDYWPLTTEEYHAAIEKVQQHSRNYAKRQLTWFRKDPNYQWFHPKDQDAIIAYINEQL